MRTLALSLLPMTLATLTGCSSAPNQPTLELTTSKSPEAYSTCVMQTLQKAHRDPSLLQANRGYRVVLGSPVAADNVIEAYKGSSGGRVYVYQRGLFTNDLVEVANKCA
jgi:hypothetical protein